MNSLVRVCRYCEHINCGTDTERCINCWGSLTEVEAVPWNHLRRTKLRRAISLKRLVLTTGMLTLAAFVSWRIAVLFALDSIIFPPPSATTSLGAESNSQSWDQARRTPGNSGFTPAEAPVPKRVLWDFSTSKPLLAGPAVSGGRVYLSTQDGRTVALDQDSGKTIWEHRSGLPSSSTPALAGDLVVTALLPGLVVALDMDTGETRWEVDLKGPIYSSPVVEDGSVYIGAGNNHLYALDVTNGNERWVFDAGDWVVASIAYSDEAIAVVTQFSDVFLVDPDTGRRHLYFDTGYVRFGGGPVIYGDSVYIPSDRGWLWAIDRHSRGFPFERIMWKVKLNLYVWGLIDEKPIQRGGLWSHRLGGDLKFTSAAAHNTVYVTNIQGQLFARDAATGKPRWTADIGQQISTAPIVSGQTVLLGTPGGQVYGIDALTGAASWDFDIGDPISASPIVAGTMMYVVTTEGNLYAVAEN